MTHATTHTLSQTTQAIPRSESSPYVCPTCQGPLDQDEQRQYLCLACDRYFYNRNGQPDFRPGMQAIPSSESLDQTEQWQNRIKMFLRQSPALYQFLVYVIGPALMLGPSSQTFVNRLGSSAKVLSIGAGVLRLQGQVTHLDYEPYSHLEVVGDAHHLPFAEGTFDGVVCETLLEHVKEPEQVIAEMHRVLKPGGKVYVRMPFMFGFHAAPNDFHRFTHKGFLHRMRAFNTDLLKVTSGPASALTCVLVEWSAILFSLGSRRLYRFLALAFLVAYAPLKLLDFVMCRHPEAVRIASIMTFIGTRPLNSDAESQHGKSSIPL